MKDLAECPAYVLGIWMDKTGILMMEAAVRPFATSGVKPEVLRAAADAARVQRDRAEYAGDAGLADDYERAVKGLEYAARWCEGEEDAVTAEIRAPHYAFLASLCD